MSRLSVDCQRETVVFRLADGTPVATHYSFGVIALLVTAPLWLQGRLSSVIIGFLLMVVLFVSILAHELGHKAAAARQGARTREIEIWVLGGMAHLEWDYHRGLAMRPVALAGPAVNLGLAGLSFALYWLARDAGAADVPRVFEPFEAQAIISRTLYLALLLNLWLALFNLLPAYPLDGGAIAEDLLATRLGVRRARIAVGICGIIVAGVGALVAFVTVLAGVPVLMPASFAANWQAIQENRAPRRATPSQPPRERVSSVTQFKKRGGSS
jgi:Zn-dependent protease